MPAYEEPPVLPGGSFLSYRRLFTFTAAFIAAEALRFPLGYEDGVTVVAHAKRGVIFSHHKAEHHLQANQQRMEIPNDGRLVQQCDPIGGRYAAEGRNSLSYKLFSSASKVSASL